MGLLPVRFADDGGGLAKDSAVRTAGAGETLVRGTALVEFAIRGDCVHYGDEERRQPGADEGRIPGTRRIAEIIVEPIDEKATKVIIRGTVFLWQEKGGFGFTPSGKSIKGVLECTEDKMQIKCHECGKWLGSITWKHLLADGISSKIFRVRHGFGSGTSLMAPGRTAQHSDRMKELMRDPAWITQARTQAERMNKSMNMVKKHDACSRAKTEYRAEAVNLRMNCMAQLTVRLTNMAARIGHTPTARDRERGDELGGLHRKSIEWAFGMKVAEALLSIGLIPNMSTDRYGGTRQKIAAPVQLKILQLRAKGLTYSQIANQLGTCVATAWQYCQTQIGG